MSRRAFGIVALLVGAALLAGAVWYVSGWKRQAPPQAPRPPFQISVTIAPVERGSLTPRAQLTGSVRSYQRARVGFDVSGRLSAIDVREGDRVVARQDLARLDDTDREARLTQARASVTLAERELALLEAGTRTEEIGRLEAQVRAAEADLAWTKAEVERMEPMRSGGVVSPSTFDAMVAQRNAANARREAALAALALGKAGTRAEELEVQRARLAQRQADVAFAEQEKAKTLLKAPFDAQVVRRLLAPGDAVNPGQAVLELVDLSRRDVQLEVPALFASRLGPSAQVTLRVDERPTWSLTTTLSTLLLEADAKSGASRALIQLEPGGPDAEVLRPGTFVRADVELLPLTDQLIVPADAVRRTADGWLLVKAVPPPPPGTPAPPGMPPMVYPPGAEMAAFVPVRVLSSYEGRAAVEVLAPPPAPSGPPGAASAPPAPTLSVGDRVVVVGADMAFPMAPLAERKAEMGGARGAPAAPAGGGKP